MKVQTLVYIQVVKKKKLLYATKQRKLLRTMIPHVLKEYSILRRRNKRRMDMDDTLQKTIKKIPANKL